MGQYAGLSRAVNEDQDIIGLLDSQGLLVMPLADVLAKLEAVLIQQPVARVTGKFDWARFRLAYPHLIRDARFVELLSDAALERGSRPKSSNLRGAGRPGAGPAARTAGTRINSQARAHS